MRLGHRSSCVRQSFAPFKPSRRSLPEGMEGLTVNKERLPKQPFYPGRAD